MANNQIVNFNRQDVANAYRRNQYAQALQERMNAPAPVHTYQGFQAPTSPAAGIAKALDIYSVWQNEQNQEKQYQAEKAAAEQKVLDENSRLEQGRQDFVSDFKKPNLTENQMPDARSSIESGIPLDQPRPDIGTGEYTSTPKTPQEKLAFALSRIGDPNQLVSTTAKGYVDQINEDTRAKTAADLAASNTEYTRAIQKQTRADMLSAREQAQSNDNRRYNLDVAKMGENRDKSPPAPLGYRFTPSGDLETIPGGPVDTKTIKANSAQEVGRDTVSSVVDQLRNKYNQLNDSKAIVNSENSVMDNLSAGVASSEIGQVASNLTGTKAQSIRNAIKMMRPLLLQQIMKATGMSAKQMDSNVELKLWLSTATDPSVDITANLDALNNIENMYGIQKEALPKTTTPNQTQPTSTNQSEVDFNALVQKHKTKKVN